MCFQVARKTMFKPYVLKKVKSWNLIVDVISLKVEMNTNGNCCKSKNIEYENDDDEYLRMR